MEGTQVIQACTPRLPEAEFANLPRIFQEDFWKLGSKPLISNNVPTIFWGYFPIQPWGTLGYVPGVLEFPL